MPAQGDGCLLTRAMCTHRGLVPDPALLCGCPFFPSVAEVPQAGIDNAFLMGFGSLFKVVAALGLDFFPPFDSRPDEIVNLADFKQLGEGRVIQ